MSEKEKKDRFYVAVDQVEWNEATHQLITKEPRFRKTFKAVNTTRREVNGVVYPKEYDLVEPDDNGVYAVKADENYYKERVVVMEYQRKKEKYAKVLIGPYDTYDAAMEAKHAARDKTPLEQTVLLKAEGEAKDTEIEELKSRIAQLSGDGPGKPAATPPADGPTPGSAGGEQKK